MRRGPTTFSSVSPMVFNLWHARVLGRHEASTQNPANSPNNQRGRLRCDGRCDRSSFAVNLERSKKAHGGYGCAEWQEVMDEYDSRTILNAFRFLAEVRQDSADGEKLLAEIDRVMRCDALLDSTPESYLKQQQDKLPPKETEIFYGNLA